MKDFLFLFGLFLSFLVNLRLIDELKHLKISRKKIYQRLDFLERRKYNGR